MSRSWLETLLHTIDQTWPPTPTWSVADVPDLTGKTIIVTGGNTGIGFQTAKTLLSCNASVYVTVRDDEKGEDTIQTLKSSTGKNSVHYLVMDLSSLASVKAAADTFLQRESRLDILINNAGVMMCPVAQLTTDGYDMQFGTNVLGHFYFTKLLLPVLQQTASTGVKPRIITVSSHGHELLRGSKIDFDTFKDGPERRRWSNVNLYYQSKFCNVLQSNELARRYGAMGIIAISLHPGAISSSLYRYIPWFARWIVTCTMGSTQKGALTQLRAATDPEGEKWNGKYMVPYARMGSAHPATNDAELAWRLWSYLEAQVSNL